MLLREMMVNRGITVTIIMMVTRKKHKYTGMLMILLSLLTRRKLVLIMEFRHHDTSSFSTHKPYKASMVNYLLCICFYVLSVMKKRWN
mgnify:CR=1 FL=1